MKAIALVLHDIIEDGAGPLSGFQGPDAEIYKLTRGEFARHLDAIAAASLARPVRVDRLTRSLARPILLTFDDGGVGAYEIAAGMLEDRGWRGHFFITTDYIGAPGFLTRPQIAELHRRGHVIGSHSSSHPARMSSCSGEELLSEWTRSVEILSGITGAPVTAASVPGGYFSDNVAAAAAAAGIRFLFTSQPTPVLDRRPGGCMLIGRFSVQRGVSPETTTALALQSPFPCWRSAMFWNLKKAAKKAGGEHWLRFRKWYFETAPFGRGSVTHTR